MRHFLFYVYKSNLISTIVGRACFVTLLCIGNYVFFISCTTTPNTFYFQCNEQDTEVIHKHISQVLLDIGYDIKKDTSEHRCYTATKKIKATNRLGGVFMESVEMEICFAFDDTSQSTISQYYVTEFNGKLNKRALSEEERSIYEKDVIKFVEKIQPYCNPQFDER